MGTYNKAILFYNTKSGQSDTDHQIKLIKDHFHDKKISLRIVDIPEKSDKIASIIQEGIDNGVDLCIAAGGDGTMSLVGNPLVGSDLPLGILPIGTGNLLAKELNIPRQIEDALEVITSPDSKRIKLDTFTLNSHYYLLNVSVGVTPKVMASTHSEEKKQFGVFAYVIHFFLQLWGLKLEKFHIEYDHQQENLIASEILITNGRLMGFEPLEWSNDITLNDGLLDIFVIRAANFFDILSILVSVFTKTKKKNPVIKSMRFQDYCKIETESPLKVQADGDHIGNTPVEVHVQPQALSIIIPNQDNIKAKMKKESKKGA
jgi:YegS/Rv2252/BmrU family lipid kinase